jgi:thiosulfate/3-mercaptopyruvate sulfurtransferase
VTEPASFVDPVVAADWLRRRIGDDDVVVLDGRWYLDGGSVRGRAAFGAGHLPGARFVDLDACEAGPASAAAGRHPLPEPAAFVACCAALGIGPGSTVVVYDDAGGMAAARMAWLLRSAGVDAGVLDGGIQAWDGPLETGEGPPAGPVAPLRLDRWPPEVLADADSLASADVVVDARAPERYRGEREPVDARAGHVPGAVNVPFAGTVDPDTGRFLAAAALRARYEAVGIGPGVDVVVYCGSGVTACHDLLAMERAGLGRKRLYAGSWSQWAADPARPVATGEEP